MHAREQATHLPVPSCKIRCFPQPGQRAFAASSARRRMHRQQSCLARKPTGAPQSAQSRCRLPTGTARHDHKGGMDRPRAEAALG
jgi:hypothetical protein